MLTQQLLDKWVPLLVPSEFGPDPKLENNKPLLGVYLIDTETMVRAKKIHYPTSDSNLRLLSILTNMGQLAESVDRPIDKLNNRFVIRLDKTQSEEQGIFNLLREIGHLDGILNNTEKHYKNPDAYANRYAMLKTKEIIKDPILQIKVLTVQYNS